MSSESSEDALSCTFASQGSDSSDNIPACSSNTPVEAFAELSLADRLPIPVWGPEADSDYDSDFDPASGKRKQRSQESESTACIQKRLRAYEEMECDGDDEVVKTLRVEIKDAEESMQEHEANKACDCQEGEETEDEEEGEKQSDAESDMAEEVTAEEPISIIDINQPSTSGLKRKCDEQAESVTAPKMSRPAYSDEEDS